MIARWLLIVLLLPSLMMAATVNLYQNWADTSTSGIFDSDSVNSGDVIEFQSNIYSSPAYKGIYFPAHNIIIDGNGYVLYPDTCQLPTLENPSFETGEADTASKWDFTDADSCFWEAGDSVSGDYAEVHRGSYSIAVHLPCDTPQRIISKSEIVLAPNIDWHCGVFVHNRESSAGALRFHLMAVNSDDDWEHWNYWNQGNMLHFMYLWIDLGTEDTSRTYRIMVGVTGGDAATEGTKVYFDDVRVTTDRYHGLVVRPDTNVKQSYYKGPDYYIQTGVGDNGFNLNYLSGYNQNGGDGDSITVRDLTIAAPSYGSFANIALFNSAMNINLDTITANADGIGSWCYRSHASAYDTILADTFWLTNNFELKRDWNASGNMDLSGGDDPYAYGCLVQNCVFGGSAHFVIYCKTECDGTDDETDDYPLNTIRDNTAYINAYYSNSFFYLDGGEYACNVINNRIYTYDGSDTLCGSGIHVEATKAPCYNTRARVDSNVIVAAWMPRNQEYEAYSLCYAIQLEGANSIDVTNNICTVYVNATTSKAAYANGLRINHDVSEGDSCFDLRIAGNTFAAYALNEAQHAISLKFYQSTYQGEDIRIDSNTFIANGCWIQGVSDFPSTWSWRYNTFKVDTLGGTAYEPSWRSWLCGHAAAWPRVDSLMFVDNQYFDAGTKDEFDSAYWNIVLGSVTADTSTRSFVCWTDTIQAKDSEGDPVIGALARFINSDGDTVAAGTTNGDGYYSAIVAQYREEAAAQTYNRDNSRYYFNDYTLFVKYGEDTDDSVVTITSGTKYILTLGTTDVPGSTEIQAISIGGLTIE